MKFDLHSHTTFSDGDNCPTLLSNMLGHNAIWSVTDHNDVRYHEQHKAVLTGSELTVDVLVDGKVQAVEVLAYGFDLEKLRESVMELRAYADALQKVNLGKLVGLVKAMGCKVADIVELDASGFAHASLYTVLAKYPENHVILGGLLESSVVFYHDGQSEGSTIYIDTPSSPFTLKQTYALVKKAGGKLFLAHPHYYKVASVSSLLSSVAGFVDGIECLHPSASEEEAAGLIEYCKCNDLLASGGSDYHRGEYKGTPHLHLSKLGEKNSPFNWLLDYV